MPVPVLECCLARAAEREALETRPSINEHIHSFHRALGTPTQGASSIPGPLEPPDNDNDSPMLAPTDGVLVDTNTYAPSLHFLAAGAAEQHKQQQQPHRTALEGRQQVAPVDSNVDSSTLSGASERQLKPKPQHEHLHKPSPPHGSLASASASANN